MVVGPRERVLLLELPPLDEVRSIAASAADGIVVGLLEREQVYEARAALRDFENVMIAPAEENGTLPWKDDFFSVIYAPGLSSATAEVLRVLSPAGTAWLASGPVTKP